MRSYDRTIPYFNMRNGVSISKNTRIILDILEESGCVYVPDCGFGGPKEMEEMFSEIFGKNKLLKYEEDKISPRTSLCEFVYTSTDYNETVNIYYHNECCAKPRWPLYIGFYCEKISGLGGSTTVTSIRGMEQRLPTPIKDAFRRHGVLYRRVIGGTVGNSLDYTFGVTDRSEIEVYCRSAGMTVEWQGDELHLSFSRAPEVRHPLHDEPVWFNNAVFWNPASLDRTLRLGLRHLPASKLPLNALLGNGTDIPTGWMAEMKDAYEASHVPFRWGEGGMLILDNMRYAHGREKFRGERSVWVAMAHGVERDAVELAA